MVGTHRPPPVDETAATPPGVEPFDPEMAVAPPDQFGDPIEVDESHDLPLHKERLRQVARRVDLLAPLKEHPYITVGAAAVLGVVAASPAAAHVTTVQQTAVATGIVGRVVQLAIKVVGKRMARNAQSAFAAAGERFAAGTTPIPPDQPAPGTVPDDVLSAEAAAAAAAVKSSHTAAARQG